MLDRISLVLVIIGALNWGSIGLFQFDIVGWLLDVYKRQVCTTVPSMPASLMPTNVS